MTRANVYTILIGIALVVLPYLLTQSDVVIPPVVKVILQAAILAVGVVARYLPTEAQPTQVVVTASQPIPTRPVTDDDA
jgi:hypothetical protein